MTAAEAECQSRMLANSWTDGAEIDLEALSKIPLCLHGESSLAFTGKFETLFEDASNWKEVDFRAIGWTRISKMEGKIWYLPNKKKNKIDAFQICHPMANELIVIATSLLGLPLTDKAWSSSFTHPSAAEIFKLIAHQPL